MAAGYALPVFGDEKSASLISSLLIKPVSAECNLSCAYCFYSGREADPYKALRDRRMSNATLARLVETYISYSRPHATFAFQGGEPTLAGVEFFERVVALQMRFGSKGSIVSNSIQTNGLLLDDRWCDFFHAYRWLVGISIDGPEKMHDTYRRNCGGGGTWQSAMRAVHLLQRRGVEFNALCVVSQANVTKAAEIYRFFRSLGINYVQYIPLCEFDACGKPLPFTVAPGEYGKFLCETFDLWWPDRRLVRIRIFDNLAEAVTGLKPSACTLQESCDSYVVVEHNGDVYPCDFFVEKNWRLGNIHAASWNEIAGALRRTFAANKRVPNPICHSCQYQPICHSGCPKYRYGPRSCFEDLDYFCYAHRMLFARALMPLLQEIQSLLR